MSGTGDLEVFRLVRQLRVQVTSGDVTYGNHMVVHMALGLLFLGGCTRALDTSNKAVAAMVAAFYPLYPATTSDNRCVCACVCVCVCVCMCACAPVCL